MSVNDAATAASAQAVEQTAARLRESVLNLRAQVGRVVVGQRRLRRRRGKRDDALQAGRDFFDGGERGAFFHGLRIGAVTPAV
ncbi:MAG: hypothetical protein ACOYM9_17100, partial [Bradymonadia bacterium]